MIVEAVLEIRKVDENTIINYMRSRVEVIMLKTIDLAHEKLYIEALELYKKLNYKNAISKFERAIYVKDMGKHSELALYYLAKAKLSLKDNNGASKDLVIYTEKYPIGKKIGEVKEMLMDIKKS